MSRCYFVIPWSVIDWLNHGERGISSEAIVSQLTGVPIVSYSHRAGNDYPSDPDDLRRCRLLLDACPEIHRAFLERMGARHRVWARLVAIWDDLCELLDMEMARQVPSGSTYALMKAAEGTDPIDAPERPERRQLGYAPGEQPQPTDQREADRRARRRGLGRRAARRRA